MARPKSPSPDTRTRILAAAAAEFGVHGFAATTVDRIARRARVNKAMIYYHFPNKRALYTCILRDVFAPITERVRAAMSEDAPPARKLDRLIDALVRSIDASAHFLPIFLREIADGGAHLGPEELGLIAGMFATVRGVIGEGTQQNLFQPVHPALAHFTIIAPLRDVSRRRPDPCAHQGRAARRHSRSRFGHAGEASPDGGATDARA